MRISTSLVQYPIFEPEPVIFEEVDSGAVSGQTYLWRLVELETDGDELIYGPYELTVDGAGRTYDDWAAAHFTPEELADPVISGRDADPDEDGLANWQEYLAGTDPRNGDSVLQIVDVRKVTGGMQLGWASVPGRLYRIALSESLFGPFLPMEQTVQATEGHTLLTLPMDVRDRQLFFQVIMTGREP